MAKLTADDFFPLDVMLAEIDRPDNPVQYAIDRAFQDVVNGMINPDRQTESEEPTDQPTEAPEE